MQGNAAGREFLNPYKFIEEFCSRRGLVPASKIGASEIEKFCQRNAEEARNQYKTLRDTDFTGAEERMSDSSGENFFVDTNETDGTEGSHDSGNNLSPEEKYQRRLQNNRKSAAATKVYHEVLRREMATVFRLGEMNDAQQFNSLRTRYCILHGDSENLFVENEQLREKLEIAMNEVEGLKAELRRRDEEEIQRRNQANTLNSIVEYLGSGLQADSRAELGSEEIEDDLRDS